MGGWDKRIGLAFWILAFAVVIFLRLPVMSDRFCDPDQGETAYNANIFNAGRCPYSDAIIQEPPGTILLYGLTFALFGRDMLFIHLMGLLWTLAAVVVLFFLGRQLAGPWTGALTAGLYCFYQADLMVSGVCANYDYWIILPALASLLLLGNGRAGRGALAAAGACAALGLMMKQTAAPFGVAALALGVVNAMSAAGPGERPAAAARAVGWFAAGFAAALVPFVVAMACVSCVGAAIGELNPLRLLRYVRSYDHAQRMTFAASQLGRFWHSNLVLILAAAVLTPIAAVRLGAKGALAKLGPAVLFFLAAVGSALGGGRFFSHYFVVLLPLLALLAGGAAAVCAKGWSAKGRTILFVALLCGALFDLRHEIALAGSSASSLAAGQRPTGAALYADNYARRIEPGFRTELLSHLEWNDTYQRTGAFLRARLQPGETILCLEYFLELYFYAGVFAPTRHFENFEYLTSIASPYYGLTHTSEDAEVVRNRAELLRDLQRRPPRFILRLTNACDRPEQLDGTTAWPRNIYGRPMSYCQPRMEMFPALREFVEARYRPVEPSLDNAITILELAPTP